MANRRSYFHEAPMEEFTPANSIHEASFREGRQSQLRGWVNGTGKPVLRVAHAVLHLGLCGVLLAIMVEFMLWYRGHRRKPQAITLTTLVAADSCLDLYAVFRLKTKWPGWAVILRLFLAMSYIALFLVYVGYRQVFPPGYAYWGMGEGYSDPVVYILLLVFGVWNLFHTAIHRHALGRDLRRLVVWVQVRFTGLNQAEEGYQSNRSRVLSREHLPTTDTPSVAVQTSTSIALGALRADNKNPDLIVVDQIGTASTSGESSSRGGSTIQTKSPDVSAVTSRRTSATALEEKTANAADTGDTSDIGGRN